MAAHTHHYGYSQLFISSSSQGHIPHYSPLPQHQGVTHCGVGGAPQEHLLELTDPHCVGFSQELEGGKYETQEWILRMERNSMEYCSKPLYLVWITQYGPHTLYGSHSTNLIPCMDHIVWTWVYCSKPSIQPSACTQ